MVKANKLIEFLGLENFFYKDMEIFYVKKPTGNKVEKHYYNVNENGEVLIYDSVRDSSKKLKNPIIKDSGLNVDSKSKKNIYLWVEGRPFCIPMFSQTDMTTKFLSEQEITNIFDLGREFERNNSDFRENSGFEKNAFLILGLLLLLNGVSLFLLYKLAENAGVLSGLFPGS